MTTRRALFASLAAAAATAAATADRGAMPPVISYIPEWDDLDADLLARAEEKWSHLFAKDERDQDDAAEDAYEDLLGPRSRELGRMRKRAGQHSGRPLGVTGIDALASVGLGKLTGAIVGALVDDDNGYVGPTYGSIVAEEEWKKRVKAADERERVFKANKEMEERREMNLAGQVWDAGWKEGSPPSRNPSRLPNYSYLPPSNPTAANWIARGRRSRRALPPGAPSSTTALTHLTLEQRAAKNMRRGEKKPRVDRARKNRARKKCARKNHARKKVQGVSAKNIKISKIKISKIKLFMICFIFIFINYLK